MADQINGVKQEPPKAQDHPIPPVRMDQSMAIAAGMVAALIGTFRKTDTDTPEELTALHLTCVAVFLHQLLMPATHKDKVIKILQAITDELRDALDAAGPANVGA